jgi:hypothetical protein
VLRRKGSQLQGLALGCLALQALGGCVARAEGIDTEVSSALGTPEAQFYASAQCTSGTMVAKVRSGSDCKALSNSTEVRSVKVGGVCQAALVSSARRACESYLEGEGRAIVYGTSETCANDTALAAITSTTECAVLSASELARSIKVDGRCIHIDATNVRAVCALRQVGLGRAVLFAYGGCRDSQAIASVSEKTECQSLGAKDVVGSVKVRGICTDIVASSLRSTCTQTQSPLGRTYIYGTTGRCTENALIGSVTRATECQTFSDTERVGSIRVNGDCKDVVNVVTARNVCINHQ